MTPILGTMASQISGHLSYSPILAYESIATTTLTGNSTNFTLSSIPGTYTHLQLRCFLIAGHGDNDIYLRFNGDTGNNYSWHTLFGDSSTAQADATTSASKSYLARNWNTGSIGAVAIVDILDYANTNKYKTTRTLVGFDDNTAHTGYRDLGLYSGNWRNTAAITSITIDVESGYSLGQYTSVALYGIKG